MGNTEGDHAGPVKPGWIGPDECKSKTFAAIASKPLKIEVPDALNRRMPSVAPVTNFVSHV